MKKSYSSSRWYSNIVRKRLRIPRTHSKARANLSRGEDLSEKVNANRKSLNRQNQQMALKPVAAFCSIQDDFIHRHHTEPRVQLYVPKDETFFVSLKYIDTTRFTRTDLDVMQEKRVGDYWIDDSSKLLSDSWRGFTKFTQLKEKPPERFFFGLGGDRKIQTTTRPDHVCPEVWTKIGEAAQNRDNQDWANEKPKLNNARIMRRLHRSG